MVDTWKVILLVAAVFVVLFFIATSTSTSSCQSGWVVENFTDLNGNTYTNDQEITNTWGMSEWSPAVADADCGRTVTQKRRLQVYTAGTNPSRVPTRRTTVLQSCPIKGRYIQITRHTPVPGVTDGNRVIINRVAIVDGSFKKLPIIDASAACFEPPYGAENLLEETNSFRSCKPTDQPPYNGTHYLKIDLGAIKSIRGIEIQGIPGFEQYLNGLRITVLDDRRNIVFTGPVFVKLDKGVVSMYLTPRLGYASNALDTNWPRVRYYSVNNW